MRWPALVLVIGLGTLTGACDRSPNDSSPGPSNAATRSVAVSDDRLIGTWSATPDKVRQDSAGPWFHFKRDGEFLGADGCNWVDGRWTLDSTTGVIRLKAVTTTLRGCGREIKEVSVAKMVFDGDRVQYTVRNGKGRHHLTRASTTPGFATELRLDFDD